MDDFIDWSDYLQRGSLPNPWSIYRSGGCNHHFGNEFADGVLIPCSEGDCSGGDSPPEPSAVRADSWSGIKAAFTRWPGHRLSADAIPQFGGRQAWRRHRWLRRTPTETETEAMAEAVAGRLEEDVDEIKQDVRRLTEGQAALSERMARLEGGFEQMDRRMVESGAQVDHRMGDLAARMANVESGQRWALGLIVTSWLTIETAVLGLYLRG